MKSQQIHATDPSNHLSLAEDTCSWWSICSIGYS